VKEVREKPSTCDGLKAANNWGLPRVAAFMNMGVTANVRVSSEKKRTTPRR
jgi:hypothetical protein